MTNVERYFDNIRVISLLRREDRRLEISAALKHQGLCFEFSDAVEDKDRPTLACAKSHFSTLSNFYESKFGSEDYLLVLEDDCVFVPDFLDKFNSLDLSVCPEWDSLRLGCLHAKRPVRLSDGLVKAAFPLDTHCILYKTTEIPRYLEVIQECINKGGVIDLYIAQQISRLNIIAAYPNLVYQSEGNSDINKKHYSNYEKDGSQKLYLSEVSAI